MQIHFFVKGQGFCVHKIEAQNSFVSAWFTYDGKVIAAEGYHKTTRRPFAVKEGGPIWKQCEKIGKQVLTAADSGGSVRA